MFVGPVFAREVAIAPRRVRVYFARSFYCLLLVFLMCTAWLLLAGTQRVRDLGDLARFGTVLFRILALLQLGLAVFFSALFSASAVSQEKDRRTLVLLLLTNLSNSELVLGKLLASLLNVLVLLVAAVPVFMLSALVGGVSFEQIGRVFVVTLASVMICGSLGSTLALWREKTFQTLAMTVLVLVLWLAVWEVVDKGTLGQQWLGISCHTWAVGFNPWHAIWEATRPYVEADPALGPLGTAVNLFLVVAVVASVVLNGVAMLMVRIWNPSRETRLVNREEDTWHRESIWGAEYDAAQATQKGDQSVQPDEANTDRPPASMAALRNVAAGRAARQAGGKKIAPTRHVWDNPIIWREMRTWAYGRKILLVRVAYLVLFALVAASLLNTISGGENAAGTGGWTTAVSYMPLVPLLLLSLKLVNAQAVTSLTSERDGQTLDLLLVSDLTPKEFVYGKLGGVFYNTKEMIALPMLLCGYLWYVGAMSLETLVYLILGLAVLYMFAAMLGVHAGMAYTNSRSAIATSLGTLFFLFVGVVTCMWMMLAFSGSFEAQLPFLALVVFGGAGLYLALGVRNPSTAIGLASFVCPLATFYAITTFFLGQPHLVFAVTVTAYGFTTVAMLIPAIDEFDVATGRTTIGE